MPSLSNPSKGFPLKLLKERKKEKNINESTLHKHNLRKILEKRAQENKIEKEKKKKKKKSK